MTHASPQRTEKVAGPASRMSVATGFSRITGLLRESVFAALLGASGAASAFVMAFRIPNLLRDFFAEGALSSAFVPTFAKVREKEGDARAFLLARRVLGTLAAITGAIALLGILFAPAVVAVIAPDASGDVQGLTVDLTRIMFPFLPLMAMAAVIMGVLNTHRRYFLPALAPALFNVVAVLGGAIMLVLRWDQPDCTITAVTVWAVLVLVGGAAQLLMQMPLLRRVGWRGAPVTDLRFRDPGLRTITRRMAPVVISLAGTNVMLVVITALASRHPSWPAWLNYAFRLVHLPIGLVGVAVGTVVLAAGARTAAKGDEKGVNDLVRRGLRLNWFLALPAAVGLWVLAEPLVRLIYERGNFTGADTGAVAAALRAYAPGIVFYAGVKAGAAHFLVRGDTRTPMFCSLAGIAVTIVLALVTVGSEFAHRGLALAVACGAATNFGLLRVLGRRAYGPGSAVPWAVLWRIGVAAALMGAVGYLVVGPWLSGDEPVASGVLQAVLTLGATVALAALYFLAAAGLGVREVAWLRRRLGGRRSD